MQSSDLSPCPRVRGKIRVPDEFLATKQAGSLAGRLVLFFPKPRCLREAQLTLPKLPGSEKA